MTDYIGVYINIFLASENPEYAIFVINKRDDCFSPQLWGVFLNDFYLYLKHKEF